MLLSFCQVIFSLPSPSPNQRLLSLSHSLFISHFKPLHRLIVSFFVILLLYSRKSALVPAKQTLARSHTLSALLSLQSISWAEDEGFYPSLCLHSVECGYEWEEQAWIGLVLNAWTPLLVGCLQMTCSSLSCDIITYRFHYIAQQIFTVEVKPELNKRDFWNI